MEEIKNYLLKYGYKGEEIEKLVNAYSLYNLKNETILNNIKEIIELLSNLEYSKNDIIKMTKAHPALYSYSKDNIKQKIDDLIDLGYSKTDVIKMTKAFPQLYSLSIDNIKQKFEFYQLINIQNALINDTTLLMQSVELSYARYMFYQSNGIKINVENYKKLFIKQKQFENTYGVSKATLLQMYNYDEFIKKGKIKIYNS